MSIVKKTIVLFGAFLFISPSLFSCAKNENVEYLKIINAEDYIYKAEGEYLLDEEGNPLVDEQGNKIRDYDLTEQFENYMRDEYGRNVKVIYDTYDTNENLLNILNTGKTQYDLLCASDYMIQKFAVSEIIQEIDITKIENYNKYLSPFMRNFFDTVKIESEKIKNKTMNNYSAGYMWGTLGILYNPTYKEFIARGYSEEKIISDMQTWDVFWNTDYSKTISIKDSMRDTYAAGVIHTYKDQLEKATTNEERTKIFNYGGDEDALAKEHINEVKNSLINLRSNIFGFEVDSGKEDIVTGKIGVNLAWSGDAVYSIEKACDPNETAEPFDLYYSIPEEGANLWCDAWALQKGANEDLAYKFLNFVSDPINVIQNVNYIGYTSVIAGDDVFYEMVDWYEYEPETAEDEEAIPYDLNYFFNFGESDECDYTIYIHPIDADGAMLAQYPKSDIIDKLMIMKDYGKNNELILKMWQDIKFEGLPTWAIILFVTEGVLIIGLATAFIVIKKRNINRRKRRREKAVQSQ